MAAILGKKLSTGQIFTEEGKRLTVTDIKLLKDHGELIKSGDLVQVTGKSKGRGFAGVVKRHGFAGVGGRTHGQSDRQRHPGSIGMRTTPGRVWKGKRMAGHYGGETITFKRVTIVKAEDKALTVSGTIPGARNSVVKIYGKN